jgi:hypothetical protein
MRPNFDDLSYRPPFRFRFSAHHGSINEIVGLGITQNGQLAGGLR